MQKIVDEKSKKFVEQIAAAGKPFEIVTVAGSRGRYFNEHGKGEMPVSHQTENSHQKQQQKQLEEAY